MCGGREFMSTFGASSLIVLWYGALEVGVVWMNMAVLVVLRVFGEENERVWAVADSIGDLE